MSAVVALLCCVRIWINIKSIVRAGLHARLAANTPVTVKVDNAIVTPEQRGYRTDRDTWCILAVIAPQHGKEPLRIRIIARFDVFNPGPEGADGYLMF